MITSFGWEPLEFEPPSWLSLQPPRDVPEGQRLGHTRAILFPSQTNWYVVLHHLGIARDQLHRHARPRLSLMSCLGNISRLNKY